MKTLTEILSPEAHQRMIDRYTQMLNGHNPAHILESDLVRKIEWHTGEYLNKTGRLPK